MIEYLSIRDIQLFLMGSLSGMSFILIYWLKWEIKQREKNG